MTYENSQVSWDFGLLIKRDSETMQNEAHEQKGVFLGKVSNKIIRCKFIRKYVDNLDIQGIIKINLDLMGFIPMIIYLIK